LRSNLINTANVVDTAFTRKIQDLNFKESEISQSQYYYVEKILGADFLDYVIANIEDFEDFLTYATNVISYGVFSKNFNRLFSEVTDRGINQFNNAGSQQITDQSKQLLFSEINNTLYDFIAQMVIFCNEQKELETTGYSLLDISDDNLNLDGESVYGKTLKNTYL